MTDFAIDTIPVAQRPPRRDIGIKKRYAAEARFKAYGIAAIVFGLVFLAIMLVSIATKGYTAFWQTNITVPVTFDAAVLDPQNKRDSDPSVLIKANYDKLAQAALATKLGISPDDKPSMTKLKGILSDSARIRPPFRLPIREVRLPQLKSTSFDSTAIAASPPPL